MRRCAAAALALVFGFEVLGSHALASATGLAGPGWSSSYAGESDFGSTAAGGKGQFSVRFFNDGTLSWPTEVVGLLVCAADKVSCGVPSPNLAYASGWYSNSVYTSTNEIVRPGANGSFTYAYSVPAGTLPGTVATFNGEVGLIATSAPLRPEGYFHRNVVPQPSSLTVAPTSASVPVGWTQRFTASSDVSWSVTGGCGVISSSGVFVAVATTATSQPCSVVAAAGSLSVSAPVLVSGTVTKLSCKATPETVLADGTSKATITIALVDDNGTVSTGGGASVNVLNVTPLRGTLSASGAITPTAGAVSLTLTSTTTPGDMLISASSSSSITGCTKTVTSTLGGAPAKTAATLLTNPVAADGTTQPVLRVDVQDASGNRALGDNSLITASVDNTGVCTIGGAGTASRTASAGRADFTLSVGSTPGTCSIVVSANNSSISGSSATLTATLAGTATSLGVALNDSPHSAGASGSATTVAVDIRDAKGNRVTGSNALVSLALDAVSCSGGSGGDVQAPSGAAVSAVLGRATFTLTSTGAYAACALTLTSQSLVSATATIRFDPGIPDHLGCAVSPTALLNDAKSRAVVGVKVLDVSGNLVTAGGPFSIDVMRASGSGATTLVTGSPQQTSSGIAAFTVVSTATTGVDGFTASVSAKTVPTMANPTTPTACTVSVQTSVP